MEIQQSPLFAAYVSRLGWNALKFDGSFIYIRNIPLSGNMAKLQRTSKLPDPKKFLLFLREHRIRTLVVEPDTAVPQARLTAWVAKIRSAVRIASSPYLPTKTIIINLKPAQQDIFNFLTSAKRRAVRRAQNLGVTVAQTQDIDLLVRVKNKSAGLFGFITTHGIKIFWQLLAPKNAAILIAYDTKKEPVGGVLLIFWQRVAYYWIAGATKKGKKLFAPTLLAWESLCLGKKHGCTAFDFVGVWDERLAGHYKEWIGFTKFKEGFGGTVRTYPIPR